MENIVAGLFGLSPSQVQQQQQAGIDARANAYANQDPFARATAGMYRAGAGIAGIGAGMMGMVNPQVEEAKRRESIMGTGGDLSTSAGLKAKAQQFAQAGDQKTAMQLLMVARQKEAEEQNAVLAQRKAALGERKQDFQEQDAMDFKRQQSQDAMELKRQQLEQAFVLAKEKAADARLSAAERVAAMKEANQIKLMLGQAMVALRQQGGAPKTQVITDASGKSTLINLETGEAIKDLGAVGKPTATYEKGVADKKATVTNLDAAILNLESATKKGGLIDKSTGSGAGALVDIGAGFFGSATPGAVAVGEMKPIFDLVLKMVPRFEGPQSDKDTKTYQDAAGQLANPAIPVPQKKAAALQILRLMKERRNAFIPTDIAGSPPVTPGVKRYNPLTGKIE